MAFKLDISGDTNLQMMHRLQKLYGLPQFVKDASYSEDLCCADTTPSLFADPREVRQFPIHTKAATYVSYLFFLENGNELPRRVRSTVQERLTKAAQYWGISKPCHELQEKHAALNAEDASPDSCYAIVRVDDRGGKDRRYPLRNPLEVKAAARWYNEYQNEIRLELPFRDRSTVAAKILKKADEMGVGISEERETLEQACGRGVCVPEKAAEMIVNRSRAVHRIQPEMRVMLTKLAEKVRDMPQIALDPNTMRDLAATIDEFDRTHHLVNKYSEHIPAPEQVLFESTRTKLASLVENGCQTLTGTVYTKDQFAKLSSSDVREAFGDEIARQVCSGLRVDPEKMAELVGTLPRNDAEMFDELMAGKGFEPLSKAAAQSIGFSFSQLQELAG